MHSVHSDGELTPLQLSAAARSLGLDFVATTDHNTAAAHLPWMDVAGDGLLVIRGEEVTTGDGHWLALGIAVGEVINWQYTARDNEVARSMDQVHKAAGLCVVAHPHAPYPSGSFRYPHDGFDAVEVWNGQWTSNLPWQTDNETALNHWANTLITDIPHGRWMPAMGNSDTHLAGQLGHPHTVVVADRPTTADILTSIAAGRIWISASPTIELSFTATSHGHCAKIGDVLATHGEPPLVHVAVKGLDSGTITIYTDIEEVHRAHISPNEITHLHFRVSAEHLFVRVEVRSPTGQMAALTNPIILG